MVPCGMFGNICQTQQAWRVVLLGRRREQATTQAKKKNSGFATFIWSRISSGCIPQPFTYATFQLSMESAIAFFFSTWFRPSPDIYQRVGPETSLSVVTSAEDPLNVYTYAQDTIFFYPTPPHDDRSMALDTTWWIHSGKDVEIHAKKSMDGVCMWYKGWVPETRWC